MAAFGNIAESKNFSHLTISKGIMEKIDAPQFIELEGEMDLTTKVSGSHMRFHIPPESDNPNTATVMLPKATPGMRTTIYLSSYGTSGLDFSSPDYNINDSSSLTVKAFSGDYKVGVGINETSRTHEDKFVGIKFEESSLMGVEAVSRLPLSTQIDWNRSTPASFSQVAWEKISLECLEYGHWYVTAFGSWVFS